MAKKSLKYQLFHIWHTFFGHNSAICWPIGLNSRDYYLSIGYKEFWFRALIAIFNFWVLLGPEKGVATHIGLGPQTLTKKLTHLVDLMGHL